jgi:uncharacterized protein involved in exopolysaccharide biosynthesis
MRTDFVKRRDREFEAQVAQFLANLGPVKTALGLPATWEAQLIARKNAFANALNVLDIAEANYRRAKQEKDATQQTTSRKT